MVRLRTSLAGVLVFIALVLVQNVVLVRSPVQRTLLHPGHYRIHSSSLHHRRKIISQQTLRRSTTPAPTTPLRGDQQPVAYVGIDDEDTDDGNPFIYPLGGYDSFRRPTQSPPYQTGYRAYRPPQRVHPCEHSSCYPATGNLLIGRENRLYASSTCGLNNPERFCIVSHLEEKKCFLCDTTQATEYDPLKNHRIGQIIYKAQPGTREQSWWQSENGKENVTVQLDLEAEFHFTHLIIVFSTFRPAAMLIERSYDFGRTWHVYKYFAHDCAYAFPGIPLVSKNITDVVCDHRYSGVEPSKNGEVIFRVLPPNMNIENPYATHVQNMLKMTNLRINFTRLHNLGDTLLDDREEIQEKYYYAISNMIVRGSCSCYGHASRCLPLEGVQNKIDMVHGRCECTHNTKGLNCEECEDFFNDLPWKPALGKQTNACKKCNCNNHATSCHFDSALYEASGRVSGGMCDSCQHNTQGQHCEQCIQFFYKDPQEDIQSPYVCKPCDCDPRGALDEGICDSADDQKNSIVAGTCHCKDNVKGRRCDTCKEGFWNLDQDSEEGCQACTCNTLGTINNSGCNMHTGECTCKRLVTGKDCNQCLPETYGLSDSHDGCSLCNCDPGGSLDNSCDVVTGQCQCRNFMTGRTCSIPKQNHFIPVLHNVYEAEVPSITECTTHNNYGNCSVVFREHPLDRRPEWTGPGFTRVPEGTELTINVDEVPRTMTYDVVLRYQTQMPGDWEDARITVLRPDIYDPEGPCANSHPAREDRVAFRLPEYATSTTALYDVCLQQGKVYKFRIHFNRHNREEDNPSAQILIDSLTLIPRIEVTPILSGSAPAETRRKKFEELGCNHTFYSVNFDQDTEQQCKDLLNTVSIFVFDGAAPCNCDATGAMSKKCDEFGGSCQCKPNVVGRQCDKCAPGTYGFGPEGCKACDCNSIGATDNECDLITGQCRCHPNTYGRECDQCQPGFWNFPNCQQCECNGHTQNCDARTGECIACQDFTAGYNCNKCVEGHYGNPMLGSEIGCRPCRCPDTIASGHTHAEQCDLDVRTNDMVCYCQEGYSGSRCSVCAENYFGNPDKPGGICEKCECNQNVDPGQYGNCDLRTGKCLKCLYETTGDHCEFCRDGFHGDALAQDCRQCECDVLGTNGTIQYCDRNTGQCPCLKNVEGIGCNDCIANHWKIASGEGCEACECDTVGSDSEQCNRYDGQCHCKDGFGGRQCNQCQANYWGNPNEQCHNCECEYYGSETQQCDRETGKCKCNIGMGGFKCDQCDRGYLGRAPHCSPCGECFDNWDLILNTLQAETKRVIDESKQIKTVGATGAYTKEFDAMEKKLGIIRNLLDNTTVSAQDINTLDQVVVDLRRHLNISIADLKEAEATLENVYSSINLANVSLDGLRKKSESIKATANDLKANATQLQEANIEGALNLTREAWNKVNSLAEVDRETEELNANAERQCRHTEALVNRTSEEFEALQHKNEQALDQYHDELTTLSQRIPDLNEQICDKRGVGGDSCDNLCGGAGCKHCGGLSCEKGALTMSEKALFYVQDTEKRVKEKDEVAEDLIRSLSHAKTNASEAFKKAEKAFQEAEGYLNATQQLSENGKDLITNLTNILNSNLASPSEIKEYIDKTLDLELELDPEEIKVLADKIDETVSQLENVETIISNTRQDLERVENLKRQANETKKRADDVLENAKNVVQALEDADTAQTKAQEAIKKAKEDISLADDDLGQIDNETGGARDKANETAQKVELLNEKLSQLQKNFLKNGIDATEIKNQADQVRDSASNAHENASQLRTDYRQANESLTAKATTSESARERAQHLLQRASKITVDTTSKLKELQGMVNVYKSNDKELNELQERLQGLNDDMTRYLSNIQSNADRYRQCTS